MKKLLSSLLLVACLCAVQAQSDRSVIYPGTLFGSVEVGGFGYGHSQTSDFGAPYFGVAGGFWISEPLALQFALDGVMGPSYSGDNSLFLFASTEFKWDVNKTFFHVYNRNFLSPIPFYPMIGLGLLWRNEMDGNAVERAMQGMLGLQVPFRLSNHVSAKFEYKCFLLPQNFDLSYGDNFMHTFSLGLLFMQNDDPFHRRTEHETRSVGDDWFVGLGIGANYSAYDLLTAPQYGGLAMVGVAPEVMLGRNLSSFWTLRVELCGLTAHEQFDTTQQEPTANYSYSFLHADVMVNISSLCNHKRGVQFNFMPYLGAGPVWRYDDVTLDYAANLGLFLRYYLNRKSDLYLDMKYVMVRPSFAGGTGPSGAFYGVGLPSLTAGYIYNFGQNTTRYRMPLNKCPNLM